MKIETYKSLGVNVNLNVPDSVEEYNKLAPGRENAVLADATDTIVYRSSLAEFRKEFTKKVAEATGIARGTQTVKKGKKQEEVTEFTETEKDYVDRVVTSLAAAEAVPPETVVARFQPIADEIAAKIKFDPSESEPGKPKEATKEAKAIVAQLKTEGKLEAVAAKLAGTYNVPLPTTDEAIGLLLSEHLRRVAQTAAAAARASISTL